MNITVEQLPQCRALLRVEYPADIVTQERGLIVARIGSQAKLPGYRPGKVPSTVIERKFKAQIENEIRELLVNKGYNEAVEKENLDVLGLLDVNESTFNDDGTFSFTANLTMAPQFDMPEYKGVPIKLPKIEVSEELVNQNLEQLRQRFATFEEESNKDRELVMDDFAVINFKGKIGEQTITEAVEGVPPILDGRENFWIQLGENRFLPGFCEGLLGMKAADKRYIELAIAEDFTDERLRGKELQYELELVSIQNRNLPEWNDELANKIEEGSSVEEIRESMTNAITQEANNQRDNLKTNQIIAWLDRTLDFELPIDLVNHEAQRRLVEIARRAEAQGVPQEELMKQQADIERSALSQARLNVKARFFLAEIAHEEKIEVTNEDMSRAISAMAQQSKQAPQKVVQDLQKNNGLLILQNDLMIQKALELVKSSATVEELEPEAFDSFAKSNSLDIDSENEAELSSTSVASN